MNHLMNMNNIDHQEDGEIEGEQVKENTNDAADDHYDDKMDDDSFDNYGKVNLTTVFQNTDNNPIEYLYTRDSTGRVVSVECRLKVPRDNIDFVRTPAEAVECLVKKTREDDETNNK